jgi:hypothetical protein
MMKSNLLRKIAPAMSYERQQHRVAPVVVPHDHNALFPI